MDEMYEKLSKEVQELIDILSSGRALKFEAMAKKGAKAVMAGEMDPEADPKISEEDQEAFNDYIAALIAVPNSFIPHIYAPGFRDGFCACLRCLDMCKEYKLDSLEKLFLTVKEECEKADPLEKIKAKLEYIRGLIN